MKQICMISYFILLGWSIKTQSLVFILSALVLGVLILACVPFYRKYRKTSIKNGVVLNVNKASWREFEQLPGFHKVSAKKAVWMRKHNGKYASKKDFYLKNGIKNISEIENLISV